MELSRQVRGVHDCSFTAPCTPTHGADGAELSLVTTMPHDKLSQHCCKGQAVVSCEAAARPIWLTQDNPHLCRRCLDLCSLLAFQVHHARLGGGNEVIEVAKFDGTRKCHPGQQYQAQQQSIYLLYAALDHFGLLPGQHLSVLLN